MICDETVIGKKSVALSIYWEMIVFKKNNSINMTGLQCKCFAVLLDRCNQLICQLTTLDNDR